MPSRESLSSVYQTAALSKTFAEYELSGQRITELKKGIEQSEAGKTYVEMTVSRPAPVGFRDSMRRAFAWLPGVRALSHEEQFYLSTHDVKTFPDFERLQDRLAQAGIGVEISGTRDVWGVDGGSIYMPAKIRLTLSSLDGITEIQRQHIFKNPTLYGTPKSGGRNGEIDMEDFHKKFAPGGTATQPQKSTALSAPAQSPG